MCYYIVLPGLTQSNPKELSTPLGNVMLVTVIFAIGIFEANAMQFGLDQIFDASSTELS